MPRLDGHMCKTSLAITLEALKYVALKIGAIVNGIITNRGTIKGGGLTVAHEGTNLGTFH